MGNSPALTVLGEVTCPWGTPTQAQWNDFWSIGDVNRDGYINDVDLAVIDAAWGSMAVDDPTTPWDDTENWNPDADLNGDGVVNMLDRNICSIHQGYDICAYFARRPTIGPTLELISEVVEPNVPFVLGGYLKAADTLEPISGALVYLEKNGEIVLETPTDASGYYEFMVTLLANETATFVAGFPGNETFEGC